MGIWIEGDPVAVIWTGRAWKERGINSFQN